MTKRVKSAKGELVDFDLLKIKEQMAAVPPKADVRARQDFIDKRLRRRLKKVEPPAPKTTNRDVKVDPKMPTTEDLGDTTKMIDEVVDESNTPQKKSTQRARPKTKKS